MAAPSHRLLVLVAHLSLSPLVLSVFSVEAFEFPKLLLMRTACVLLLAAWAYETLTAARGSVAALRGQVATLGRDPLALALGAFLVSAALSTIWSVSPRVSFYGSEARRAGLTTLALGLVLFLATRAAASSRNALAALGWACAVGYAGATAYTGLQLAGMDPVGWTTVHRAGDLLRPGGTLGNPIFLGAFLAASLPVVAWLAARALRAGRRGVGLFLVSLAAAGVAAIAASLSRGAWAAALAGLGTLALLWWRAGERRAAAALAAAAACLVLVFAGLGATPLGSRFASAAGQRAAAVLEPASEPRLEFWRVATVAFAARPWLGSGLDSFQLAYQRHQGARAFEHGPDSSPGHAHNEVVQVAATQGSVGLAALALVAAALVAAGSRAFRGSGAETRAALAAPLAGLAALAVQGLFSFTVTALGALGATWLGVVSSASRVGAGNEEGASARSLGATLAACAALAASLLLLNGLAVGGGGLAWLGAAALALPLLAVALAAWRVESAAGATHPRRATGERRSPSEASTRRAALAGAGVATCAAFTLKLSVVDPFWADALERRGLVLLEETSPSAALPYLAEAARREPGREAFWRQVGVAHHRAAFEAGVGKETRRAHLESSASAHARARDLVPASPLNYANLGRALADLARVEPAEATREAARAAFARALSLAPLHARVLEDAAKAELFFGDPAQAERLAKRSLSSHPRHAAAWALVAAAAMERRDFAAAEAALRSAAAGDWRGDRAGEAAGWANLATVLLALERPREAAEAAERALTIDPGSEPAQRALARVRGASAEGASAGTAAKAR